MAPLFVRQKGVDFMANIASHPIVSYLNANRLTPLNPEIPRGIDPPCPACAEGRYP